MGGTPGTDPRLVQRMPLAASAEHEKKGIHRFAVIDAGPMAPQGLWVAGREERRKALPQHGRDAPVLASFLVDVEPQCGA